MCQRYSRTRNISGSGSATANQKSQPLSGQSSTATALAGLKTACGAWLTKSLRHCSRRRDCNGAELRVVTGPLARRIGPTGARLPSARKPIPISESLVRVGRVPNMKRVALESEPAAGRRESPI